VCKTSHCVGRLGQQSRLGDVDRVELVAHDLGVEPLHRLGDDDLGAVDLGRPLHVEQREQALLDLD